MNEDLRSAIEAAIVLAGKLKTNEHPSAGGQPLVLARLQEALSFLPPAVEKKTEEKSNESDQPAKQGTETHSIFQRHGFLGHGHKKVS